MKSNIIVKVQVSIATSEKVSQVLVYNEDRSIEEIFDLTEDIKKQMNKELKKFFYARINKETKTLILLSEAPWQDW